MPCFHGIRFFCKLSRRLFSNRSPRSTKEGAGVHPLTYIRCSWFLYGYSSGALSGCELRVQGFGEKKPCWSVGFYAEVGFLSLVTPGFFLTPLFWARFLGVLRPRFLRPLNHLSRRRLICPWSLAISGLWNTVCRFNFGSHALDPKCAKTGSEFRFIWPSFFFCEKLPHHKKTDPKVTVLRIPPLLHRTKLLRFAKAQMLLKQRRRCGFTVRLQPERSPVPGHANKPTKVTEADFARILAAGLPPLKAHLLFARTCFPISVVFPPNSK